MTVDWRQNPDGTLVRGTRISSYRKLQCNYKCYKCVKQTHSQSGVRKRSKNCRVSYPFFGLLSFTSLWRLTHTTHTHTNTGKWGEDRGSVSGWSVDGREVDRLGVICGVSGRGRAPPRPDGYSRPPLTRLGLIRIYWPDRGKVCQVCNFSLLYFSLWYILTTFPDITWPSLPGHSQLKANEMISHWTGDCRWN